MPQQQARVPLSQTAGRGPLYARPTHGRAHPMGMVDCPPMPTVSQSEAARRLGVSRRTIKRRIEAGELPTPDGVHVVLPDPDAPIPAHEHAQADAHRVPTSDYGAGAGFPSAEDLHTGQNFPTRERDDLAARLECAESRIDRLLGIVDEQNRTIQAQTIRLAQLEGRMIDTRAAEPPVQPPEPVIEPDTHPATWRPQSVVYALEGWALGRHGGGRPLGRVGIFAALQLSMRMARAIPRCCWGMAVNFR